MRTIVREADINKGKRLGRETSERQRGKKAEEYRKEGRTQRDKVEIIRRVREEKEEIFRIVREAERKKRKYSEE